MTTEEIELYLKRAADRPSAPTPEEVAIALQSLKAAAVNRGEEQEAKRLWCLEETLRVQDHYLDAFQELKRKQFYDAWCSLERAEVLLGFVGRHIGQSRVPFRLDFIAKYVEKWQSLFPYRVFFTRNTWRSEKYARSVAPPSCHGQAVITDSARSTAARCAVISSRI